MEPREILTLDAGQKNLTQQRVISYVKGHELSVVHDMIKRIIGSIVREEFLYYESSREFIIDNARDKRCGEHVV